MSIRTFAHKGLQEVFETGKSRRIGAGYLKRVEMILSAVDGATGAIDLRNARGFHALKGDRVGTYAMKVSGNMRITFRFEQGDTGDILDLDFEDYH
jgi:toxin HigB-1